MSIVEAVVYIPLYIVICSAVIGAIAVAGHFLITTFSSILRSLEDKK